MNRLFLSFASLIIMLVLNCFGTYSQVARIGAVHSKPTKFNDYLILERDYPDASYWDIKIQQRDFDVNDSIYVFSDAQITRMSRSFYKKVDSKYLNDEKYFITVLGYNGDDEIIVEEGPFAICNECQIGFSCQWGCIAGNYAYSLNLNPINSGSSMLSMNTITPPNGLHQYYYEYVKSDNWSNYSGSYLKGFYGVSSFDYGDFNNAGKIIVLHNLDLSDNIKDISNSICLGTAYGIRKYLGPWFPSQGNMVSNEITAGESNCGQSYNWAKEVINDNEDNFSNYNVPNLNCSGSSFSPTEPEDPIQDITYDFAECIKTYFEGFDSNGNFVSLVTELGDCESNVIGNAFEWPNFVENIIIGSLTDTSMTPINLNKKEIIDNNGNFIFNGLTLNPSFYYVGMQIDNGIYVSSFFEVLDTTFYDLNLSNFLNYNPYPNPITSNVYQIDFEATANVEFVYEVKDNLGKSVFSRSYKLDKDETLNDRISLTIPSSYTGMLFNTITFTDSSTLQFTMIK